MSNIEWTDATWNPVIGCAKVAQGCKHCYAEKMSKRLRGMGQADYAQVLTEDGQFNGKAITRPEMLDKPLRWKKPRMVFVNSMSDLFHKDVPFEFIAAVYGVMAACPQHTFQVLTKRPERMREFFDWVDAQANDSRSDWKPSPRAVVVAEAWKHDSPENGLYMRGFNTSSKHADGPWPLHNVWHGVSVATQADADKNIPVLLQVPSAIRFVSAEPLVGEVDLRGWGSIAAKAGASAPKEWGDYEWPEWIPENVRGQIVSFWSCFGRNPQRWVKDNEEQLTPATGSTVGVVEKRAHVAYAVGPHDARAECTGRWIHCWNNIGRIILDDGRVIVASAGRGPGWLWSGLHWVIVGGESGPGARPFDIAWARSIIQQCKAANVPVFVKQMGSRLEANFYDECRDDWEILHGGEWPDPYIWTSKPYQPHIDEMVHLKTKDRKGGDPSEWPEDLRVREFPKAVTA